MQRDFLLSLVAAWRGQLDKEENGEVRFSFNSILDLQGAGRLIKKFTTIVNGNKAYLIVQAADIKG